MTRRCLFLVPFAAVAKPEPDPDAELLATLHELNRQLDELEARTSEHEPFEVIEPEPWYTVRGNLSESRKALDEWAELEKTLHGALGNECN